MTDDDSISVPSGLEEHTEWAKSLLHNAYEGGGGGLSIEQSIEAAKVQALLAIAHAIGGRR